MFYEIYHLWWDVCPSLLSVVLCELKKASTHEPPQDEENKIGCKIRLDLPLIRYHGIHGTQYFVVQICGNQYAIRVIPLHWRHNDHDGVSNHQPHVCLFNRLFRRRSKKTSKLRVTGLCAGNSPGPVNSPHKGPVTRKMLPFDNVIMRICITIWFAMLCCGLLTADFTNILQGYLTDTGHNASEVTLRNIVKYIP